MAFRIVAHPLVRHKLGLLRRHDLPIATFRDLTRKITSLLAYEAFADLALETTEVDGWAGTVRVEYYRKLSTDIADRRACILNPMLATGHPLAATVDLLKHAGCKSIRMLCLVAAPEGVAHLAERHPDVDIYAAGLDERLDEDGYILPGLGDAGDRLFGTC